MGARRQTGKQASRDFDMVTPEALPEPSIPPFPLCPSSLVCTTLRLFVGACLVSGWALSLSLGLWSVEEFATRDVPAGARRDVP